MVWYETTLCFLEAAMFILSKCFSPRKMRPCREGLPY